MGIGKKMTKGMIGGGVNIAHKSKMSNAAKNQMSFPGGMPGPGNYGSMDNKIVGKGMMKYLAGESVGMKKYGQHKGPEKALVGKQENLPEALKDKIEAAPGMYGKKKKGMKQMGEMEEAPMSGGPGRYGKKKKSAKKAKKELEKSFKKPSIAERLTEKKVGVVKKSKGPGNYEEAKKKDPKLDSYIKERKKHKPGSSEYEAQQSKINAAYGKKRDQKLKASQIASEKTKSTGTTTKTETAKKNLVDTKVEVKENQEARQDTRKSKRIEKRTKRVQKREDIRSGRAKAKADGLKGKAKRDAIKASKKAAKENQNK